MIRFLKITFLSFFIATSAVAGSDGELELSKKNNSTKDCFEPLNRATFALNQGLDKAFFKPVAKGYRSLPSPIKKGTGNVLNNLSTLITSAPISDKKSEAKGPGNKVEKSKTLISDNIPSKDIFICRTLFL